MKQSSKSSIANALIIKRSSTGEADRVITILTSERGRIVTIAKGVRKLTSSRGAFLEPGNLVKIQLIETKSMPILTQATLIDDTAKIRTSLAQIRQLSQLLEIIDKLFVEEELEPHIFNQILKIRQKIVLGSKFDLKKDIIQLVEWLGYQNLADTEFDSILDYVAQLTGKKMRSFEWLKPK
ncbi:DNA repair protein RecO [Patescibacteria group bacterium]|nr:DNA repair protein RecO [Patescibacteria group bacterium]